MCLPRPVVWKVAIKTQAFLCTWFSDIVKTLFHSLTRIYVCTEACMRMYALVGVGTWLHKWLWPFQSCMLVIQYLFVWLHNDTFLICWMQFLRKMAQPYDKTGGTGRKTLLSQEDLEKMAVSGLDDMMYWGMPTKFSEPGLLSSEY